MYCGCGSKLNKTLWTVFMLFAILTIACFVTFGVLASRCSDRLDEAGCINNNQYEYSNACVRDVYRNEAVCPTSSAFFYLGILALIVTTIPLYVMCCCSPKPSSKKYDTGYANYQAYDASTTAPAAYDQPAYGNGKYGSNTQYGTSGSYGQPAYNGGYTQGGDVYDQYGGAPPAGGYRGQGQS